jgi:catechol-2,3-dioxygenase
VKLQPIIYTTDSARLVAWYQRVLGIEPSYQSEVWSTFDVDGAPLAIHQVDEDLPSKSRVSISLVATGRLEDLMERWSSVEVEVTRGIQDETFGRSVLLTDPDGTVIQVNQHF